MVASEGAMPDGRRVVSLSRLEASPPSPKGRGGRVGRMCVRTGDQIPPENVKRDRETVRS